MNFTKSGLSQIFSGKRILSAIIFGAAFSLVLSQEILPLLWPIESLRLKIISLASFPFFVLFIPLFWEFFLQPKYDRLIKTQKTGVVLLGALTPLVLAIAILDGAFFDKTVYFLLPEHTFSVEVQPDYLLNGEDIVLTGIYTQSQKSISFNSLEIRGWTRKKNVLIFDGVEDNMLAWRGKPGERVFLIFETPSNSFQIRARWDDLEKTYDLFPSEAETIQVLRKFDVPLYASWVLLAVADYLSLGFVIFVVSVVSVVSVVFSGVPTGKFTWLLYATPMYFVWSIFLLAFWPGFMTHDSLVQWGQIITGKFVHANPVAHTLTMWLITRLWYSPAAVALFQILALGSALGWGIAVLREYGYPRWAAWLTCGALALSPANAALSITLWKDILFSAVVIALTILIFRIVASKGVWLNKKNSWVWFGTALLFVSLYRLNGLLVSLASVLSVGLIYRQSYKPVLKAATLFLAVYFLFTGPFFDFLKVRRVDMARDEYVAAHLLAGHMTAKTSVVIEARGLLEPASTVYPWPYTCYRNSAFFFESGLDRSYLISHSREIIALAIKATLQNPRQTLEHFACQADNVYRISKRYPEDLVALGLAENDYGFATESFLPKLRDKISDVLIEYIYHDNHGTIWFVWRMPFWMYLSVYSCVIFCLRNKDWKPLLILIPALLVVLPYLLLTLGQIFRYLYSMYLVGILLSGYFLVGAFHEQQGNDAISH